MIRLAAAAALLFAVPPAGERVEDAEIVPATVGLLQITVQQIVIRVPRRDPRIPAVSHAGWRETAGPRCIPARQIAGAMPSPSNVDLLMRDDSRIRARLSGRCAALDYYRGLYVNDNRDGQLCAGRDAFRSRMGGQCDIAQFRVLRPPARVR